jgi:NADH dehydrogenase FAD-containing subunit
MIEHAVVIAGAGPTGLMLAGELGGWTSLCLYLENPSIIGDAETTPSNVLF